VFSVSLIGNERNRSLLLVILGSFKEAIEFDRARGT
jgi:hypothetical protein